MSRKYKVSKSRPLVIRSSVYSSDVRHRQKSGRKTSKNAEAATESQTKIAVTSRDDDLFVQGCSSRPLDVPATSLDEQDWADEELEDLPSTRTSPNQHLREWLLSNATPYLTLLFFRDAAPKIGRHNHTPTHFIRRWNGKFWQSASLAELGLVLHLGHDGRRCAKSHVNDSLLVGDIHGFSNLEVTFCECDGHSSRTSQLLAAGFMACSDNLPQSAFTLNMLDHLSIFSTAGKCSVFKYYTVLKRMTQTGFPGKVADRYRELLQTLRKYNYLMSRKRSGAAFQRHSLEKDPGEQAIPCVACPRPTYNFNHHEVESDEKEYFRFWASFDGNFRNPRKAKKVDPDDICLTDGQLYFPEHEKYLQYLKSVDSQKKKLRYAYTDYAVACFVQYVCREGNLKIGLTYDIWCQWFKNLKEREGSLPPGLSFPEWIRLVGGVPKFHLMGHKQACYDRYSLNYMQFVGRMEGEGCERAWAYLNEMAGSTSEMSPGFRRDTICYIMADWNYGKVIGIAIFLSTKYKEALKGFGFQRTKFAEIDMCLTSEQRRIWSAESLQANEDPPGSGIWRSVFSTPSANGKLQKLATRKQTEESESSHTPAKKVGVTQWLISGMELESEQKRLKDLRTTITKLATRRQKEQFDAKQKALNERILLFREERDKYMGDYEEPDHPSLNIMNTSEPEDAQLGLPSSYSRQTMQQRKLERLVDLEADIRRADCHDTLDRVRELLGAKALMVKIKKANTRGVAAITRAESKLRAQTEKVQKEQWRYNHSRDALIRLGATEADLKIYQKLADVDLRYLKDYSENDSRGLGQGYASPSWIWTGRSELFKDESTWLGQTLKVEWFRTRERYKRWEEELKLLKREMVMSYRSFKTYEKIWEFKAEHSASALPRVVGMAEYAYAKSDFFRQLADGVMRSYIFLRRKQMEHNIMEPWKGLEDEVFGLGSGQNGVPRRKTASFQSVVITTRYRRTPVTTRKASTTNFDIITQSKLILRAMADNSIGRGPSTMPSSQPASPSGVGLLTARDKAEPSNDGSKPKVTDASGAQRRVEVGPKGGYNGGRREGISKSDPHHSAARWPRGIAPSPRMHDRNGAQSTARKVTSRQNPFPGTSPEGSRQKLKMVVLLPTRSPATASSPADGNSCTASRVLPSKVPLGGESSPSIGCKRRAESEPSPSPNSSDSDSE
ncbi:hypothetical protein RhiJN_05088 [Ceratobasidium sp. AG-Ba]|nr:hypothetical protein RhiJN_05088 [Ceratobasidium sp. AG-Ba]